LRAFLPGEFNAWGGAVNGRIDPGSPALMEYFTSAGYWFKKIRLEIGKSYAYKFHLHSTADGSSYDWLPDPLNPLTDGPQFGNSVVAVTSPMIFEPEAVRGTDAAITKILAGVFARPSVSRVTLVVGSDSVNVTGYRDPGTEILSYLPLTPIPWTTAVQLVAKDPLGGIGTYRFPTVVPGNRKLDVTLLFHANQSLVPYARVADRASFRGLLRTLRRHPKANIQLHISGMLVHDLQWFGDSTLQMVREGIHDGQFEIFGSAYAQNVMYSTRSDTADFEFNDYQIKFQRRQIEQVFGVSPKAFWNPERVWTQNFVQLLADNGYTGVPVEDHILLASGTTKPVFQVRTTRFNGRQMVVFPDGKPFIDLIDGAINTGNVTPVLDYLHARYAEDVNDNFVIGYYQDAEATGLWDYERYVDPETNFRNLDILLAALEQDTLITLTTYEKFLKSNVPVEDLTPIRTGAADWMGRDGWFAVDQHPEFSGLRMFYDGIRRSLDSVQLEIRTSAGDTASAAALLRHAWFTVCAHQFEFGCVGLEWLSGAADAHLARTALVSAAAAHYALHPTTRTYVGDINRDGVDEVVVVNPGNLFVFSAVGGRLLYWFDLVRGEELVGNENFMSDYNEPYVDDNRPVPLVRGTVNTFTWLAPNTLLPEIFQWEFTVRKRALNDILTVGAAAPQVLEGQQYSTAINGNAVTFETVSAGVRVRKFIVPQATGLQVSYRLVSNLSGQAQVGLEVRNSLSPSVLEVMEGGRSSLAYRTGSGISQAVTGSTLGVVNTRSATAVNYSWGNPPDQLAGQEDVFALELNPRYVRTLNPGDSTEIGFTLWKSSGVTSVAHESRGLPVVLRLEQNFPNPFNPSTVIGFEVPNAGPVSLRVYDVLGRMVRTLTDEEKSAGSYLVVFDAAGLASGVYYYTLTAAGTVQTRRMLLLR
jgi:hypothetical protein